MATLSFTQTPIYSGGQLVGIDDPIQKVCRLPTEFEKIIYKDVSSFQRELSKIKDF